MAHTLDRREFFEAHGFDLALDEPPAVGATPFLCVSRRAMACPFEILVPANWPDAFDAAHVALDEIDRLETQLTVYSATSEVSRLNALASQVAVPVEEGLFDLLRLAARLSAKTEGAFDITAGPLTKCWGFYRGPRRVPAPDELKAVCERVGMRHVLLEPESCSVRYLRPGVEINLGSIGKGYALDCVARLLHEEWNLPSALLHGGRSSVYALGVPPSDPRGWTVGLADPRDPVYRLGQVRLKDRALGTSAATFQHLEHEGRKLGHILDPRTGWPAEGMLSATVAAPTAAEADALATAFFILGVEKARAYCENHPDIGAVLKPQPELGQPLQLIHLGRIDAVCFPKPLPVDTTER